MDLNRSAYEQTNFNTIPDYYDIYHKLYLDIWGNNDNNIALHFGYYDNNESKLISHNESIIKMNKFIAEKTKIKKSDLILDAGYSVGGSSIWFAKNYVTDITSNVINSYIEGLKLKILIYLLNQKNLKKI